MLKILGKLVFAVFAVFVVFIGAVGAAIDKWTFAEYSVWLIIAVVFLKIVVSLKSGLYRPHRPAGGPSFEIEETSHKFLYWFAVILEVALLCFLIWLVNLF